MSVQPISATTKETLTFAKEAGENLESKQYTLVKITSGGTIVSAASGSTPVGVLLNNPASGETATVCAGGITKVIVAETVKAGELVASNNEGKGQVATSTQKLIGICLFTAESSEYAEVLVTPGAFN